MKTFQIVSLFALIASAMAFAPVDPKSELLLRKNLQTEEPSRDALAVFSTRHVETSMGDVVHCPLGSSDGYFFNNWRPI